MVVHPSKSVDPLRVKTPRIVKFCGPKLRLYWAWNLSFSLKSLMDDWNVIRPKKDSSPSISKSSNIAI